MKQSAFMFTDPILRSLTFRINSNFVQEDDTTIPVNLHTKVSKGESTSEAVVELTVTIGSDENCFPFCIEAVEMAKFTWDESINDKKDSLLKHNAPALLLGYLRPMIATITAASPFNAYTIPFIDFVSEDDTPENEKKRRNKR